MKKSKSVIVVIVACVFVFGFLICGILLPDEDVSETERRRLTKIPEISVNSVLSGKFMTDFEAYALDQFPLRDNFRKLKSIVARDVMFQKDNNGYYDYNGYIIKSSYPYNGESVSYATSRFNYIYETYLKETDSKVYFTLIPDKSFFVPQKEGYLTMDYTAFSKNVAEDMKYAEFIDVFPLLELSDYYATDTHWRQEKITDVAVHIADSMGVLINSDYTVEKIDIPFYGVYHGQSALSVEPDTIYYLESDTLKNCTAKDIETGLYFPIYDMEKLSGEKDDDITDPYEMFLSGPNRAIVELENKNATSEKELIIFRDSYANAIAPMLLEGYKKITLIDIRRASPRFLGEFVEFNGQDVLFMQSTLVLNESSEIK